jgi:DNA modification methylase
MNRGSITYTTYNPLKLPIPKNTIDLVITKIPELLSDVRMGIDSSKTINLKDKDKYLSDLIKLTIGISNILKPGGSFFVKSSYFADVDLEYLLKVIDINTLNYCGEIIEHSDSTGFENGQPQKGIRYKDISRWHHFSKGDPYVDFYNLSNGGIPIWKTEQEDSIYSGFQWVYDRYPAALNEIRSNVAEQIVKGFSKPGDTVFDPFGGTGTVSIVSSKLGRNAISNDPNSDIIKFAKLRTTISLGEKFVETNVKVLDFE